MGASSDVTKGSEYERQPRRLVRPDDPRGFPQKAPLQATGNRRSHKDGRGRLMQERHAIRVVVEPAEQSVGLRGTAREFRARGLEGMYYIDARLYATGAGLLLVVLIVTSPAESKGLSGIESPDVPFKKADLDPLVVPRHLRFGCEYA